jgi:hypothetical protein
MSDRKDPLPTGDMWDQLMKAASVRQFIGENEIGLPAFSDYIRALCRERGEAPERVIKRAGIERSYGHSLFRGDRRPSRDTVLQLAFGFEADVELAQSLLRHAGHSTLYPKVPRDTVIGYCLIHKTSFIETQQILMELDLPLIGGGTK